MAAKRQQFLVLPDLCRQRLCSRLALEKLALDVLRNRLEENSFFSMLLTYKRGIPHKDTSFSMLKKKMCSQHDHRQRNKRSLNKDDNKIPEGYRYFGAEQKSADL